MIRREWEFGRGIFFWRKRKQGEIWVRRKNLPWEIWWVYKWSGVVGILGLGAKKYDFIELGS